MYQEISPMLQLAAYQGKSLFPSRMIRWQTDSVYSHIAVLFTEKLTVRTSGRFVFFEPGNVIEAWKGGVRKTESLSAAHEPGTPVDLFSFKTPLRPAEELAAAQFLCAQLGRDYDYRAIFRFLTREPMEKSDKTKWFCSELAFQMSVLITRPLLERVEAWRIRPCDVPRSPLLKFESSLVTT